MPVSMPTKRPRKARPVCAMLNPWLFWKTSGNAPKNRYRMPRRIAERMQRFRHWTTHAQQLARHAYFHKM